MTIEGFENFVVAPSEHNRKADPRDADHDEGSECLETTSEEEEGDSDDEGSLEETNDMLRMPKSYFASMGNSSQNGSKNGHHYGSDILGFSDSFVTDGDCTEGNLGSDEELEYYNDDTDGVNGVKDDGVEDILSFDSMLGKKAPSSAALEVEESDESEEEEEDDEEEKLARRKARKGGRSSVRSSKQRSASRSTSTARRGHRSTSRSSSKKNSKQPTENAPPSLMAMVTGGEGTDDDQEDDIFSILAVAPLNKNETQKTQSSMGSAGKKKSLQDQQKETPTTPLERRKTRSKSRGRDEKLLASSRKAKAAFSALERVGMEEPATSNRRSSAAPHPNNISRSSSRQSLGNNSEHQQLRQQQQFGSFLDASASSNNSNNGGKLSDGSSPQMTQSMPMRLHTMDTSFQSAAALRRDSSRRGSMTDASCPVNTTGAVFVHDFSRRGLTMADNSAVMRDASRRRLSVSDRRGRNSSRHLVAGNTDDYVDNNFQYANGEEELQYRRSLSRNRDNRLRRASSRRGSSSGIDMVAQSEVIPSTSSRRASDFGIGVAPTPATYRRSNSHNVAAIEALAANPYSRRINTNINNNNSPTAAADMDSSATTRRPSLLGSAKDTPIYRRSNSTTGTTASVPPSTRRASLTVVALDTPPGHRTMRRPSTGVSPGRVAPLNHVDDTSMNVNPLKMKRSSSHRDSLLQQKPSVSTLAPASTNTSGGPSSMASSEHNLGGLAVRRQDRRAPRLGHSEASNGGFEEDGADFWCDADDAEDEPTDPTSLGAMMSGSSSHQSLTTMGKSNPMSRRKSALLQSMGGKNSKQNSRRKISRSRSEPTEQLHMLMSADHGTMAAVDIDDDTVAAMQNIHGDETEKMEKPRRASVPRKAIRKDTFKLQKGKSRMDAERSRDKAKPSADQTADEDAGNNPPKGSSPKSVLEMDSSPLVEKATKKTPAKASLLPQSSVSKMFQF